ncbi:MAG: DUF559 domain-containing protein [Acidimicrobiales bacterium]|nr:DUF559 domain-containing protein [Acidimicrobiales bacterium]
MSALVLRVAGSPHSREQEILAAVWSCGPTAVASHSTAAWLHRLDGARLTLPAEVTVLRPARGNRQVARVHETRVLTNADRGRCGLIPVMAVPRTLVALAAIEAPDAVEAALDGALRDGLVSHREMVWHLERLATSGRAGCALLLSLLGAEPSSTRRCESWLETECLRLFRRSELPEPQVQRVVRDSTGRVLRADFAFAEGRLAVEVSGHATHATRRRRQEDAERRAELALLGIAHLELTYEDVTERPDYVVRRVRQMLEHLGDLPAQTTP